MPGSSTMVAVSGDAGTLAFMKAKIGTSKVRRQRWPQDVYGFQRFLDGNAHQIWPIELSDRELWAIGALTVQWAYLEHALLIRTAQLAQRAKIRLPVDATSLSFKRRLAAFRQTVRETVKTVWLRELYLNLAARMSNAADARHKLTHGLWEWYIRHPKRLRISSFRPPVQFEDHFDLDRILRVIDRVGEISFVLSYPPRRRGKQASPYPPLGAYVSRLMLLDPEDRAPPTQALPLLLNPGSWPSQSAFPGLPRSQESQ